MTMERAAAGELRRVVTAFPTNASAQDAEMSLADYEDFVYRAGFLDDEDPVASWQALGEKLARLAEWLGTKKELRVVTEGTDLTVGVEGRTWIPCDGKENFPDGEVFTGPVETSVEGNVRFSFPAPHAGRLVARHRASLRRRRGRGGACEPRARTSSGRCSRWTRAPGGWASSRSG